MHVVAGSDFDLLLYVYDGAEDLAAADATPTVAITKPDGTAVTPGAVSTPSTGLYKTKVGALAQVTRLRVEWTYVLNSYTTKLVEYVDVDGAYLFHLSDLRALPELSDATRYPLIALNKARDEVTTYINDFCQTAFVPTYGRDVRDGQSRNKMAVDLWPATSIISVTVDGVAEDTTGWTIARDGLIRAESTWTDFNVVGQNVVIEYVYGHTPTPADLKHAALKMSSYWLMSNESSIPDRARMMTTSWGTFQLSTASMDFPTGIPEVDSVLGRYRLMIPGFA